MSEQLNQSDHNEEQLYDTTDNIIRLKKVSSLIGLPVENPEGDNLGDIEDIVVDYNNNEIRFAVISFGGFLGFGEKLFAIPWKKLSFKEAELTFILNIDKEIIKNAPSFYRDKWPVMTLDWIDEIHQHYGIRKNMKKPLKDEKTKQNQKLDDNRRP